MKITRTIVYEGERKNVINQILNSLPEGECNQNPDCKITITQDPLVITEDDVKYHILQMKNRYRIMSDFRNKLQQRIPFDLKLIFKQLLDIDI